MRHTGIRQRLGEQPGQSVGVGVQRGVDRVVGGPQRCQPGGHRHRVTRQSAGLIHRPQRRQPLHHLGSPAERGGRQSAAHHLAEGEQVSGDRIDSVPTTSADPEPRHHLVDDQQRAVLGGDRAQRRVVAGRRRDDSHVAGAGFGDHRGDLVAEPGECLPHGVDVVVGQHNCVGRGGAGDPGRGRQTQRRHPRTRVGEQRVHMAVVAAGELDDLGPAGEPAGQPDRAHGGLGAGVDQPYPLDGRHPPDDLGGQLALRRRRRPERQAGGGGFGDGVDNGRVRVAQDHRAPRADQVDVAVAVGVGQPAPARLGDEARSAAHRGERADRGVHPAGNDRAGVLEQLGGCLLREGPVAAATRSELPMTTSVPAAATRSTTGCNSSPVVVVRGADHRVDLTNAHGCLIGVGLAGV